MLDAVPSGWWCSAKGRCGPLELQVKRRSRGSAGCVFHPVVVVYDVSVCELRLSRVGKSAMKVCDGVWGENELRWASARAAKTCISFLANTLIGYKRRSAPCGRDCHHVQKSPSRSCNAGADNGGEVDASGRVRHMTHRTTTAAFTAAARVGAVLTAACWQMTKLKLENVGETDVEPFIRKHIPSPGFARSPPHLPSSEARRRNPGCERSFEPQLSVWDRAGCPYSADIARSATVSHALGVGGSRAVMRRHTPEAAGFPCAATVGCTLTSARVCRKSRRGAHGVFVSGRGRMSQDGGMPRVRWHRTVCIGRFAFWRNGVSVRLGGRGLHAGGCRGRWCATDRSRG